MPNLAPSSARLLVLLLPSLLAGCVTLQGGSVISLPQAQALNIGIADLTDSFSPQLRELKKLVADSKLNEADAFFGKEQDYFLKRYQNADKALPDEINRLGDYVWMTRYKPKADQTLARLVASNSVADKKTWPEVNSALTAASQVSEAIEKDPLLQITKFGAAERLALDSQTKRITALAMTTRKQALASTFESTISSGKHEATYIVPALFAVNDYLESAEFQAMAIQKIQGTVNREAYAKQATVLGNYLSPQSRAAVDSGFAELVRKDLMADGQISLEEVSALGNVKTPFGNGKDALSKLVTIGYVDLTSASFKDRNVFDFQIAFKQDLALELAPAGESVFSLADISRFDYLFVTDLSVAKVSRQFKGKKETPSRAKTGTRDVQNPEYITAMSNYQRSMAEFQRAQISSAMPKACQGWGCVLQGVADGIGQGVARSNVDKASSALAGTSQTLAEPVYAGYAYQLVDINTSKTADVTYYVIDVKRKRILKNNFQINDNEIFSVAYNVRDEDPDKASILRNLKSEEEVTSWEKKPMTVGMSTLFSAENLKSSTQTPYSNLQAFLKTLNTRTFAAATPTYSQGKEPMASRASSRTVADDRFDSIVILRNSKATGTGFYVTPDLVLTAYHVVEGNSLVEMTFYDGTKTYGKVVDHDIRLDLALVKAQTAGKPLKIHAGPIKLGETVEAIGHPKGYEFTITRGVISAMRKQRSAAIGSNNLVEFVQTDTAISPGNSGGPLLLKDAVIGVNDWIRVDKGSQNLNFSVSFNEIREYLDRFSSK